MKHDPRYLLPADSAWLRMERPTNLMTITGVLTLEEPVAFERFCSLVQERLLRHDRFRQRVIDRGGFGRPFWDEIGFDLTDHVERVGTLEGDDKAALERFVSEQMSRPLDYEKPLWKFYYIENFAGGSALVSRIHHCIGDGIALMKVVLELADATGPEPVVPRVGQVRRSASGSGSRLRGWLELARAGGSATAALARLATMRSDPATPLKGGLGERKLAVWSRAISLAEVKEVGKRLDATVNDVLLTAATGALRAYVSEREAPPPENLNLRAVVPVNIRAPDDFVLENRFGLVFLSLPIGVADHRRRLEELKTRMRRIKRSPEAFVVYGLLKAVGKTTAGLQGRVVQLLGRNATAVMTNVPGPASPLSLCGSEVKDLMFWVPQSGDLGLGVSILSYNEVVRVGVATDEKLVPDPQRIVSAFDRSLDELAEA